MKVCCSLEGARYSVAPAASVWMKLWCGLRGLSHRFPLAHGGMGYAKEYHVERYMREAMLARIAPVSREMILNYISERVLELPKSY